MNKTLFKNHLLHKQINELVDDILKPMSILQIQKKYDLEFPFKVKRVRSGLKFNGVTTITEIRQHEKHRWVTNNTDIHHNKRAFQSADIEDYVLFEQN